MTSLITKQKLNIWAKSNCFKDKKNLWCSCADKECWEFSGLTSRFTEAHMKGILKNIIPNTILNCIGYNNINNTYISNEQKFSNDKYADDWSHSIYLYNINANNNQIIKNMDSNNKIWNRQSVFSRKKINFDFGKCNNFEKIKINGNHPNIDLIIPISV